MSKYNFECTIGELFENPTIHAEVEKSFPEVLENPMLDMAMGMRFCDVLPYVGDMISEEDLEKFRLFVESVE